MMRHSEGGDRPGGGREMPIEMAHRALGSSNRAHAMCVGKEGGAFKGAMSIGGRFIWWEIYRLV